MNYRLYTRLPGEGRFKAMDYRSGRQVRNLIYATMFSREEAGMLRQELEELHKLNPGWKFEIRAC